MKIFFLIKWLSIFVVLLSSCKKSSVSIPGDSASGSIARTPDVGGNPDASNVKIGEVISVEKYYMRINHKYLKLAEAENADDLCKAFDEILLLHSKKDIQSFKLSCVFFYQAEELYLGIDTKFRDPSKKWVRKMAEDLLLVLNNILQFSFMNEKCALIVKVFATGLGAGSLDEYPDVNPSVNFLREFCEKLDRSLK
jgi:hypothetical protein